ncbi:hypothetical protein HNY73_013352 [Argiope bruennichi]|uniref:Uncharacterized protein n=1 Tax=Argiope bruennichi TaxID=94029 RepID=A0A8T0F2J9_ARGBR|nr:hypothetical protein HNY73_013352 [Argiope bruennichi]
MNIINNLLTITDFHGRRPGIGVVHLPHDQAVPGSSPGSGMVAWCKRMCIQAFHVDQTLPFQNVPIFKNIT